MSTIATTPVAPKRFEESKLPARPKMYLILSSLFLILCGLVGAFIGDRLEAAAPSQYADLALVGPVIFALVAGLVVLGLASDGRGVRR